MVTVGRADDAFAPRVLAQDHHQDLRSLYTPPVEIRINRSKAYAICNAIDRREEDDGRLLPTTIVLESSLPYGLCILATCNLDLGEIPAIVVPATDPRNFVIHHLAMEQFDEGVRVAVVVWMTRPGLSMPMALAVGYVRLSCRDSADGCMDSDVWCLSLADSALDLHVVSGAEDGHGNVHGAGVFLPKSRKRDPTTEIDEENRKNPCLDDPGEAMAVDHVTPQPTLRWFTAFMRAVDAMQGKHTMEDADGPNHWDCILLLFAALADGAAIAGLSGRFNRGDLHDSLADHAASEATQHGLVPPSAFGIVVSMWVVWKSHSEFSASDPGSSLVPPDQQFVKSARTASLCSFIREQLSMGPVWPGWPQSNSQEALTVAVLARTLHSEHGRAVVQAASLDLSFDIGSMCVCIQRRLQDAGWLHRLCGTPDAQRWLATVGVVNPGGASTLLRGCSSRELLGMTLGVPRKALVPAAPPTSTERLEAACVPACVRVVFGELYGHGEPVQLGNQVRWRFSAFMATCLHPVRPVLPALASRGGSVTDLLSDAARLILPDYDGVKVRTPNDLNGIVSRIAAYHADPNQDESKWEPGCYGMIKEAALTSNGTNRKNHWYCPHAAVAGYDIEDTAKAQRLCREDIQGRLALLDQDEGQVQLASNWHHGARRPLLIVNQALAAASKPETTRTA